MEWKLERASEGMLGWYCNWYYCSIQLCVFLSAEWKLERASEGMLGWYSVTVISIQLCVFVCPVEAGEGQGGNNGEGV